MTTLYTILTIIGAAQHVTIKHGKEKLYHGESRHVPEHLRLRHVCSIRPAVQSNQRKLLIIYVGGYHNER